MHKKILVTGGLGFIGSHTVVELCNAGYEPIIVDNLKNSEIFVLDKLIQLTGREISFYNIDLCEINSINKLLITYHDITGIIHFAAFKAVNESTQLPLEYYNNNINSLLNVIRAFSKSNISLVFSSSCTVYGQPEYLPVTEQTPYGEIKTPYGKTKRMCEEILIDIVNASEKLNAISLRYFNPVGAHPSGLIGELPKGVPSNLMPFITQTAKGKRDFLTVFGNDYNTKDGSCIRDFIHVVDLAKAHVKALDYLQNQTKSHYYDVFNVGTGEGTSVFELIDAFEKVNQLKIKYVVKDRREGDIEKIYADTTKINNFMGWRSTLGIEDACRDAWNWELNLMD